MSWQEKHGRFSYISSSLKKCHFFLPSSTVFFRTCNLYLILKSFRPKIIPLLDKLFFLANFFPVFVIANRKGKDCTSKFDGTYSHSTQGVYTVLHSFRSIHSTSIFDTSIVSTSRSFPSFVPTLRPGAGKCRNHNNSSNSKAPSTPTTFSSNDPVFLQSFSGG